MSEHRFRELDQAWERSQAHKEEQVKRNQLRDLAHSKGMECIFDKDGDVCVRAMLFDEEGKRIVRHQPDPCDFQPFDKAMQFIQLLGTNDN